jgi:hypothetical protein
VELAKVVERPCSRPPCQHCPFASVKSAAVPVDSRFSRLDGSQDATRVGSRQL